MAKMNPTVITNAGQRLMSKLIAGARTNFTKIVLSDRQYNQGQLEAMTSIADVRQQSLVSRVERTADSAVRVEGAITNSGSPVLNRGYHIRTIGLYATDPDAGEILYSVTIAEEADYMPAYNGKTSTGIHLKLVTVVDNSANVLLDVDPAAVATIADFNRVHDKLEAHLSSNKPHLVVDGEKTYRFGLAVKDGKPGIIYEEVTE